MSQKNEIYTKVGEGPNLLFLHGWKQDRCTWNGIVDQLKQDFCCWTVDLPGFGQNPRPKDVWAPDNYAMWVGKFIAKNDIKNPTVIGHSFGGRVAIILASENSKFEIRNSKFILYATPGFPEPLPYFTNMAQALARATKSWIPVHRLSLVRQIKERMRSKDFKEAEDLQDIFLTTIAYDLSDAMSRIQSPTLLLWGERDAVVPLKIGQAMKETIAGAELKIMPKLDHFAHLENPVLFAGIVRQFAKDDASVITRNDKNYET